MINIFFLESTSTLNDKNEESLVYGLLAQVIRENNWQVAVGPKPSEAGSGSDSGAQAPNEKLFVIPI